MNKVYIGTLDRFGYDITVVCKTEQECKDKILEEYVKAYKSRNNDSDPCEDIAYGRHSENTYYAEAEEDIEIREYTLGKVEWE